MATLNEIADSISGRLDFPFDFALRERVKFDARTVIATLIRRDSERNFVSSQYLRTFIAKLKIVDMADTCAATVGCPVLRTVNTMPNPVRLNSSSDFKFVGDLEGNAFVQTELEELKYTKHNKYTSKAIRFATINNYAYVFNNIKLKWIKFEAAWENPNDLITACTNVTCFTDDTEYPISLDMVATVVDTLVEKYANLTKDDKQVEQAK